MSYGRGHKISLEECQRRVDLVSPNIEVLEYKGNRTPSPCRCKLCGNEWMEPAKNLFRGSNCPVCFKRKNNNWTTEMLINRVSEIRPDIEILGDYINMNTHVSCRCKTCGHEWLSKPSNLLHGVGCDKCAHKLVQFKLTKTHAQFMSELRAKDLPIEVLGKYQTAKTPIACSCRICGCHWTPTPTNLLSGLGCPDCGRVSIRQKQLKAHEQFVEDLASINPDIEAVSQYQGSHALITLRCKVCGEEWQCMASNATSHASGCPTCTASHGEKAIAAHLKAMSVNYIPQHRFDGLVGVGGTKLSYDFYLPDHNVLIEYQGEHHDGTMALQTEEQFIRQQEHDARKREYATSHGYRLIEIWYWDFTRIQEILNKELCLSSVVA